MSILVDKKTKVIVQGLTGTQASFHIQRAIKYGTNVVAGVVPNKKESSHLGIPLFSTVKEAKKKTGANASLIFVPANFAKNAILEAIEAEIETVVIITSGIPVSDMLIVREALENSKTLLIGPNTPGIMTPKQAYLGIFPDDIQNSGNIGIISRSSTLTYEAIHEINSIGMGESTIIGLGDDFVIGSGFNKLIEKFNEDKKTKAIVLLGGLRGNYELEASKFYKNLKKKKPIIALIVEDAASLSTEDGLASEVICSGITSVSEKKEFLRESGIIVVDSTSQLKEELLKL
jgi:succinyl-CoA synthetase alpha subunit